MLLPYLGKTEQTKYALKSTIALINFIFPDMRPPTANQPQGLTVVQQHIYYIGLTFGNIDKFKKRPVKSGLVWSRTLSMLLSMNGESVSDLSPCSWANILKIFLYS